MNTRTYTERELLGALAVLNCLLRCPGRDRSYDPFSATIIDDGGGMYWECLLDDQWLCDSCHREFHRPDPQV